MITLTDHQAAAVRSGKAWYKKIRDRERVKPIWVLSGIAGSGKTTIISRLVLELGLDDRNVKYMAYTGAAAQVLMHKGLPASTIHQTIYDFHFNRNGIIVPTLKGPHELDEYKLLVVDEASMVPEEMVAELLFFRIPIIFVGDHNQLPPVNGEMNTAMQKPDVRLIEPVRQAMDNSIIAMAAAVIGGQLTFQQGRYGDNVTVFNNLNKKHLLQVDQVITRTNRLRAELNATMRADLGFEGDFPQKGEKLVCRKNNWTQYVPGNGCMVYMVNGLQLLAEGDATGDDIVVRPSLLECKEPFHVRYDFGFLNEEPDTPEKLFALRQEENRDICRLKYGYALTGHAMQGSEVDTVLIRCETYRDTLETTRRWLYTCITRARKHAVIVT